MPTDTTRSRRTPVSPPAIRSRSRMSTDTTEQVELMPAASDDIAHASSPAITRPLAPVGSPTTMNREKSRSLSPSSSWPAGSSSGYFLK